MRIVLIGMRRSPCERLRQLLGEQASAIVRGEDAPARFQAPSPDVRRLMTTLGPNLVTFDEADDGEALAGQLERAGQWLDNTREIALIIGHVSAAEAAASALLANEDIDAAFNDWMEDAQIVLGFIESKSNKVLLVNVRAACEAPADLSFQFEMRFARNLLRQSPSLKTLSDDIVPVFVPAAKAFLQARPDVDERDTELMNVATLRERAFGLVSTDRILRSTAAMHRHSEHLEAKISDTRSLLAQREAELTSEIQLLDHDMSAKLKESRIRGQKLEEQISSLRETLTEKENAWRMGMVSTQRQIERAEARISDMEATRWWRIGAPVRGLWAAVLSALNAKGKTRRQVELVRADSLFSETWYLARYHDAIPSGADPAEHFVLTGWVEQKSPGPGFDIAAYTEDNPDVAGVGMNPFIHYINSGRAEGRPVRAVREREDNMSGGRDGA